MVHGERNEIWATPPSPARYFKDFVELTVTWQRFEVATRTLVHEHARSGTCSHGTKSAHGIDRGLQVGFLGVLHRWR